MFQKQNQRINSCSGQFNHSSDCPTVGYNLCVCVIVWQWCVWFPTVDHNLCVCDCPTVGYNNLCVIVPQWVLLLSDSVVFLWEWGVCVCDYPTVECVCVCVFVIVRQWGVCVCAHARLSDSVVFLWQWGVCVCVWQWRACVCDCLSVVCDCPTVGCVCYISVKTSKNCWFIPIQPQFKWVWVVLYQTNGLVGLNRPTRSDQMCHMGF